MMRVVTCIVAATMAASGPPVSRETRAPVDAMQSRDTAAIVTLTRSGCRGFCPAYSVAIGPDRWIRFTGTRNVRIVGRASHRMSRAAMTRLLALAATRPLASFDAAYDRQHKLCSEFAMDLPSVTLSMRTSDAKRQVHYDEGCMNRPPKLDTLARMIDSIAGTSRWIPAAGERSRSAPTQRPS